MYRPLRSPPKRHIYVRNNSYRCLHLHFIIGLSITSVIIIIYFNLYHNNSFPY